MDELEVLQAQIAEMQKRAEALASQRKAEVIADVKNKIRTYGLTARDLGLTDKPHSMAGTTVPVKYRHGELTWTGRGRQPKWLEDYIASGGRLEDLLV